MGGRERLHESSSFCRLNQGKGARCVWRWARGSESKIKWKWCHCAQRLQRQLCFPLFLYTFFITSTPRPKTATFTRRIFLVLILHLWASTFASNSILRSYLYLSNISRILNLYCSYLTRALFRCEKFWVQSTVALSFVFGNYCPTMDYLGSKDSSRKL